MTVKKSLKSCALLFFALSSLSLSFSSEAASRPSESDSDESESTERRPFRGYAPSTEQEEKIHNEFLEKQREEESRVAGNFFTRSIIGGGVGGLLGWGLAATFATGALPVAVPLAAIAVPLTTGVTGGIGFMGPAVGMFLGAVAVNLRGGNENHPLGERKFDPDKGMYYRGKPLSELEETDRKKEKADKKKKENSSQAKPTSSPRPKRKPR